MNNEEIVVEKTTEVDIKAEREKKAYEIFINQETFKKFVNFNDNLSYFSDFGDKRDYIKSINDISLKIMFNIENNETDLDWLHNLLTFYLTENFYVYKQTCINYKAFEHYNSDKIVDEKVKIMMDDFVKKSRYDVFLKESKEKIISGQKMTNQEKEEAYVCAVSNQKNIDVKLIKAFFKDALLDRFTYHDNLLYLYTKALVEKFLANKGIKANLFSRNLNENSNQVSRRGVINHKDDGSCAITIDSSFWKMRGEDIHKLFITLFHEMRHAVQSSKVDKNIQSYDSLLWSKETLIRSHYGKDYYEANYQYLSTEVDARIAGNIYTLRFLKDLVPDLALKLEKQFEDSTSNNLNYKRVHERGMIIDQKKISIAPMDHLVTDILKENKDYLNKYPVLLVEYHPNGNKKSTKELLSEINILKMQLVNAEITINYYQSQMKMLNKIIHLRDLDHYELFDDIRSLIQPNNKFDIPDAKRIKVFSHVLRKNYLAEIKRLDREEKLHFEKDAILRDFDVFFKDVEHKIKNCDDQDFRKAQLNKMKLAFEESSNIVLSDLNTRIQKYEYGKNK